MLSVPIMNAQPGMRLAVPVRDPARRTRVLLKVDFELTQSTIDRLAQLGIPEIWVRYPGLAIIEQQINPELQAENSGIARTLLTAVESAQGRSTARVPYETYLTTMTDMINGLLADPTACTFLRQSSTEAPSLMDRASTVSHLSLLMGLRLRDYLVVERPRLAANKATDVTGLGLGAMLHDIGVLELESAVQERFEETGDTSDPAWREHVTLGHSMVSGRIPPSAAVIVRNHHQGFDGTGFPAADGDRDQRGRRIHVFARIVAVAESFCRFCHPRRDTRVSSVEAMRQMVIPPGRSSFDPRVLHALLEVAPPYAPGKMIRLSDGTWAVPVSHDANDPCRPTVQPVATPEAIGTESRTDAPPPEVIDLRQRRDLSVVFAEDLDVGAFNFDAPKLSARTRMAG